MPAAEKTLIAQIRRRAASAANLAVIAGIGDDCAVLRLPRAGTSRKPKLPACGDILVTTDFSLEGVHFRREWHPPEAVGHRCLARGLSDIAAMGGSPLAAFLSLAVPRSLPADWIRRFMDGLLALAARHKTALAGGDTAESPYGILADIVVVGEAPKGKALLRSGARPGDLIFVSGKLGGSAASLSSMMKLSKKKPAATKPQTAKKTWGLNPEAYARHFFPEPRLDLARALRERNLVSAMIDTSDGLSTDLAHICEESGVGAELVADAIPRAELSQGGMNQGDQGKPTVRRREIDKPEHDPPRNLVDLQLALHGGEDYELLFTAPAHARVPSMIAGIPVTQIGRITPAKTNASRRILLRSRDGSRSVLKPQGWEHFRA